MVNNIIDMEKEFEIKALEDKIEELEAENTKLKILNEELGGDADTSKVSSEEVVCIKEIEKLRKISDERPLSNDEVKAFDLFVKNLKLIRGDLKRGKKSSFKNMSNEELKKLLKEN